MVGGDKYMAGWALVLERSDEYRSARCPKKAAFDKASCSLGTSKIESPQAIPQGEGERERIEST